MNAAEISDWLRSHCAAWPAGADLGLTRRLRERLASLPEEISGISLKVLKDTALPPWRDEGLAPLAERLGAGGPPADEAGLRERLRALPLPGAAAPATDAEIAAALVAARALRGTGENARAGELLAGCARAARRQAERTVFALWLLEVARGWLDKAAPPPLHSRVEADLGGLLALVGDIAEGMELIGAASRRLLQSGGSPSAAWLLRYEAAQWGLRTRTMPRAKAIAELKEIQAGAPAASAAWFHAGFELIFASATPGSQAADLAEAEQLVRQLDEAGVVPPARDELMAHAHQVLGHALHFGNNRVLHTQARDEDEKAVARFRAACDWPNLAQALDALGRIRGQLGEHDGADKAFEESIELKQQVKDLWGLGASFNGRASSLVRRGEPLKALPLYDANLALLRQTPGAAPELILQNLGQKVTAYLAAYQNPLANPDAEEAGKDLPRAAAILAEYAGQMEGRPGTEVSRAYHLMLDGALARLEARLLNDGARRLELLTRGEAQLRRSIAGFRKAGHRAPLPNAHLHLGGLLTDHARAVDDVHAQEALLRRARRALRAAEDLLWDSYERTYLELEWAWYYRTTGPAATAENYLTSARLHARACGNAGIESDVGTALGTHLRGPDGSDRWEVVLPPGTRIEMAVFALDWRGRPVPGYDLRAAVVPGAGADDDRLKVTPSAVQTDPLGRAVFTIEAPRDGRPGTVVVEVRDHELFREARATVHVQPFEVESHVSLASRPPLDPGDLVVLRNLFGHRFRGVLLRKEFGSGLSGSRVFLVEPVLAPLTTRGGRPGHGPTLRGQPCLVKIGTRHKIHVEFDRYEKYVRDVLPPNVSRIAARATWEDRAGIRMSLAGDQEWERARDEIEWLVRVSTPETRHLLDNLFTRDLGRCWYKNSRVADASLPLYRAYGREMPVLLTVREDRLGTSLSVLSGPRPGKDPVPIAVGLMPPGPGRQAGGGPAVYLGMLRVEEVTRDGKEWKYELVHPRDGLRVALRTSVAPHHFDRDGVADNLIGQKRHLVGVIEEFAFDRLLDALRVCVATCPVDPAGERLTLSGAGDTLEVFTRHERLSLRTPLFSLYKYLDRRLHHRRSIIHGDLHTRNVIVSQGGVPYYIDFSDTGLGPTLFDFIKHEAYLWCWSLAGVPGGEGRPECTLTEAVRLMRALTHPRRRFPAPLTPPDFLSGDPDGWQAKFYECVGTIRSLARNHRYVKEDEAGDDETVPDYFLPLALYTALMLRWCHPDRTKDPREKEVYARQGVFLTILAGLLLDEGVVVTPAGAPASRP